MRDITAGAACARLSLIGMHRRAPLVLAGAAALLLGACGGGSGAHDAGAVVDVSVSACGHGWAGGEAGEQHLVLRNTDSRPGSVDLIDAGNGAVYADVEPLAPGTSTTLSARLGAGRYAIRCYMEDEPAITGPTITLHGAARGDAVAVQPVDQGMLIEATKGYESYVRTALPGLAATAATLHRDLALGDLSAARRDWLPAQLSYLRLGAAYEAFGDLDAAIDARADGLPDGVHDPAWRGLHRIEYGLWHGEPAASLVPLATDLVQEIAALQRRFPKAQIDPRDIAIRAHEITEDAVEFPLTGRDDYGSHAGLAELRADLGATRTVLDLLRSLLASRYAGMAQLDAQLARAERDVDATRHGTVFQPLDTLPRAARQRIDSDFSQLAELLAPVAAILEPRRTS